MPKRLQISLEEKRGLGLIAFLIFLIWCCWPMVYMVVIKSSNLKELSLGDWYTALNALFAGFAFTGVIVTLYLQSQEITRVRDDAKRQQFENIFFQLLNTHRDMVNQMTYSYAFSVDKIGETVRGKEAFAALYEDFTNLYKNTEEKHTCELSCKIDRVYKEFYKHSYIFVSHYFRTLYNTVKFIDDHSEIIKNGNYVAILKAHLSAGEVLLLFYNCISAYGRQSFKGLVKKYQLIEHLDVDKLIPCHLDEIGKLYEYDESDILKLEWFAVRALDGGK